MAVKTGSKELRSLTRQLRPGLTLLQKGTTVLIVDKETLEPLRDALNRPVGLPVSPSMHTINGMRGRLFKVGALATR